MLNTGYDSNFTTSYPSQLANLLENLCVGIRIEEQLAQLIPVLIVQRVCRYYPFTHGLT